jgi:MFS family permease
MLWADLASIGALLVALAAADTRLDLIAVYASVVAVSVIASFDRPASEALLPLLAGPGQVGRANSVLRLGTRLAMIAGPALGSWLISTGSFRTVLAMDAATFLVSAVLVAGLTARGIADEAGARAESMLRAAVAGARYAARAGDIRVIITAIGLTVLVGQIVNAGTVAFVSAELGEPPSRYGLLLAAEGAGAIVLAVMFTWLGPRVPLLPSGAFALVLTGGATVALGTSPNIAMAFASMAVMGVGVVGMQVAFASYLQERSDDAFRGRVMSLTAMVAAAAGFVGLAATGPLVAVLSIRVAFGLAGAVILLAAGPVLTLLPASRWTTVERSMRTPEPLATIDPDAE